MGTIELTLAMILSGTIGVFVVESGASPLNVVFFRCVFGALALGLYCLVRGYLRNTGFTPKTLALTALGGVFIVFNWVFLFSSIELTSISVATVVYHTQPFYVLFLGAVIFRDKITLDKVGWVVAAFIGLVLITGLTASSFTAANRSYLIGIGQALLAALLYALATLIAKRLKSVRPHLIALVQVLVGIPLLLPFTDLSEVNGLGSRWGWLIGLGVIHTCVMYILMYSSFQKLPTAKIAVLCFIYPAVAMIVDLIVYGHHVSLLQALGVPLILGASLGISQGWRIFPRRTTLASASPQVPIQQNPTTDELTTSGASR
jgi:drug/metabolite transporter (DMT)-like permease